jgi:hypothetical protein
MSGFEPGPRPSSLEPGLLQVEEEEETAVDEKLGAIDGTQPRPREGKR